MNRKRLEPEGATRTLLGLIFRSFNVVPRPKFRTAVPCEITRLWTFGVAVRTCHLLLLLAIVTDPKPAFAAQPCATSLTEPPPLIRLLLPRDGDSEVDTSIPDLTLGLGDEETATLLTGITLVPLHGELINVAIPEKPRLTLIGSGPDGTAPRTAYIVPLPLIHGRTRSISMLKPGMTYVVVLRVRDPDTPIECGAPLISEDSYGSFTTGVRK